MKQKPLWDVPLAISFQVASAAPVVVINPLKRSFDLIIESDRRSNFLL